MWVFGGILGILGVWGIWGILGVFLHSGYLLGIRRRWRRVGWVCKTKPSRSPLIGPLGGEPSLRGGGGGGGGGVGGTWGGGGVGAQFFRGLSGHAGVEFGVRWVLWQFWVCRVSGI